MKLHRWCTEAMFQRYGMVDNADQLIALEQEETYVQEQLKKQRPN